MKGYECVTIYICCIVLTSLSWERRFQARVITQVLLHYVQYVPSEEQKYNSSHGFAKQRRERVEGMKGKRRGRKRMKTGNATVRISRLISTGLPSNSFIII
jgi:hypothetical protein